jgi:hypothetical protein
MSWTRFKEDGGHKLLLLYKQVLYDRDHWGQTLSPGWIRSCRMSIKKYAEHFNTNWASVFNYQTFLNYETIPFTVKSQKKDCLRSDDKCDYLLFLWKWFKPKTIIWLKHSHLSRATATSKKFKSIDSILLSLFTSVTPTITGISGI